MKAAYVAGGLGRNPLGLLPSVAYPLMLVLTKPDGFWVSACGGDKRGSMWRPAYRELAK